MEKPAVQKIAQTTQEALDALVYKGKDMSWFEQETDTAAEGGDTRANELKREAIGQRPFRHEGWVKDTLRRIRYFFDRKVRPMRLFTITVTSPDPEAPEGVIVQTFTQPFGSSMEAVAEAQEMFGLGVKIDVQPASPDDAPDTVNEGGAHHVD